MSEAKSKKQKATKRSRSAVALFAFCFLLFAHAIPTPASAVNGKFDCWCQDETTRVCNHYEIDSGIEALDSVWPLRYTPRGLDGKFSNNGAVSTVVGSMSLTPARRDELVGLCRTRCATEGGKTAINYETTYREEICESCNADPNSSCTEERGARLAFGDAQTEQLIAACEDRQAQSLLPMKLAVPIGGINQVAGLPDYINVAYRYLVTVVLVVAIVMVVYGGFRYLVGASIGDIQAGKKIIVDAIVGMLIVLGAYTILSTINPATTLLSFTPPEPIECRDLALPEAIKNARCSSDRDCAAGSRCVEGQNYIFSVENVAKATIEGGETGAAVGEELAESGGVLGFLGDGVTPGQAAFWGGPAGLLGALLSTETVRESGVYEAGGAVLGGMISRDAQTILELRQDIENVRLCSTGEQGSPCLEDQSCRAGLKCIRSWSICWAESGNRPGQPCDSDAQCSNGSCVAVMSPSVASVAIRASLEPDPSYPYKVCEIDVHDSTSCFRPNNGQSQTVFPIQCNGVPGPGEFTCVWCPSGEGGVARNWTYLSPGLPFPAQCKPRAVLTTPTPCAP